MTYLLGLLAVALLAFALLVAPGRRARAPPASAACAAGRRTRRSSPSALVDRELRITLFEGLALARAGWRAGELVGRTVAEAMPAARARGAAPARRGGARGPSAARSSGRGVRSRR